MKTKTLLIIISCILFLLPVPAIALTGSIDNHLIQTDMELSDDVRVSSVTMDFSVKTSVLTFMGNVTASNPDYVLKCDRLLISFDKDNHIESMQAQENVLLKAENGEITCHKAGYSRSSGEFILEQNVTMQHENTGLSADRITVLITGGKFQEVHCEGNVRGSLPVKKN